MNPKRLALFVVVLASRATLAAAADEPARWLERPLHHLRIKGPREWSEFAETPERSHLELKFAATKNDAEQTLRLRQQDVKQAWHVLLNGKRTGQLVRDENDM